jgi:hypothetical protein
MLKQTNIRSLYVSSGDVIISIVSEFGYLEYLNLETCYKCFNNRAPQYLSSLLDVHRPVRNLRSSSEGFIQPRRYKTEFYGARAFQVAAPRLWNALPPRLWNALPLSVRGHWFVGRF